MVFIKPFSIPKVSLITLAAGARQFVVQEALEMMLCLAGSYISSLTPSTIVRSSPFAGAEMMTFFAPPCRCAAALAASVKRPVDSITISTPRSAQGICAGSRCENTLIVWPFTISESGVASTSPGKRPYVESYFKRWAFVLVSVMSLTATTSSSYGWSSSIAFKDWRPMRPKPLIPMRVVIITSVLLLCRYKISGSS